ncbi:VanZ family protein [Microbacterium sp. SORGH_AS_0888]|uniref:VanZ family protein n=1 Tax=Microbacterium sp. SORGH_AS_0888 TaxID=3041791 RepID=UPI002784B7F2|nr:VanZ family protein [Microbacterium sp. SORGH_AS_0888]MDQ1129896.1 hypothetical protein [Microbacterium sp. SORGH_AS_0888]
MHSVVAGAATLDAPYARRVQQVHLGVIAVVLGGLAGIVLFVPFVALSYRRRGGLSVGRSLLWIAAVVYFWAIWTYTLLPLPEPDAIRCAGVNLDVWAFVDDIRGASARPGNMLTDPAVLQLALNVVLFLPLGFFVRVLGGRGILVAVLAGLGTSLFIETTQLTGVWGLYPCAYRVFDVDDLLTNTTGALLGSIAGFVVPARHRGLAVTPDADDPDPVTRRRRLLAMLCDVLGAAVLQVTLAVGGQLVQLVVRGDGVVIDGALSSTIAATLTAGLWLVVTLATGRTIGDLATQLRYASAMPAWLARPLRFLGGIGGWMLLGALPAPWSALAGVYAVVAIVLLFTTAGGRGIPGLVTASRLVDARATEPARPGR